MNLRPSKLADFIGQEHIKRLLSISIQAAKSRGDALNHVLLSGPAGIGKTTLAFIIAQEMGAKCQVINGATIQEMSALEEIFRNLAPFDVVFIDEIHRLPRQLEEFLYHPMEDRIMTERVEVLAPSEMAAYIDLTDEIAPELLMFYPGYKEKRWEKTGKYTMKEVKLPSFTLVGATTQPGDLSKPLRDRFQLSLPRLRYYSVDELVTITRQKARMLNLTITDEASRMLAKCSGGVPRICVNFILRCRDLWTSMSSMVLLKTWSIMCLDSY